MGEKDLFLTHCLLTNKHYCDVAKLAHTGNTPTNTHASLCKITLAIQPQRFLHLKFVENISNKLNLVSTASQGEAPGLWAPASDSLPSTEDNGPKLCWSK